MRHSQQHLVAIAIWIGAWGATGVFAADPPTTKEPKFAFKLLDDREKLTSKTADGAVTFEITSGSRGGRAEITLTEGNWPADLTIRIARAYPPDFSLSADNGSVKLFGRLSRDLTQLGDKRLWAVPSVCWFDDKGKGLDKLSSRVKYAMTLTHIEKENDGVMEVVLPPRFCDKDVKSLRLHWINALE